MAQFEEWDEDRADSRRVAGEGPEPAAPPPSPTGAAAAAALGHPGPVLPDGLISLEHSHEEQDTELHQQHRGKTQLCLFQSLDELC